jgi:hypothetical protein
MDNVRKNAMILNLGFGTEKVNLLIYIMCFDLYYYCISWKYTETRVLIARVKWKSRYVLVNKLRICALLLIQGSYVY